MKLIPKNWAVFQHYKDRNPPWIKLHRETLNDRTYMTLPIASKALAPLMWLLASESKNGVFDGSVDDLMFRLHITKKEYEDGVKPLIDKGFFEIASGVLADCEQDARPETETEREAETKKETKKETAIAVCPNNVDEQVWSDFLTLRKVKKAPMTVTALAGIKREADKANWSLDRAITECVSRGWVGFKAEWVEDKPKLFNKADIVHQTVPSSSFRDPALVKMDEDRLKSAPPNPEVLAKMRAILGKTA